MHQSPYCEHCSAHVSLYGHKSWCRHYVAKNQTSQTDPGQIGFDMLNGDPTVGLGSGLVMDLCTGDVELQIAPGIDIDLSGGNDFSC